MHMNPAELQKDPAKFQHEIWLPTGSGTRQFGPSMASFQRRRFSAINPSLLAVAKGDKPPIPRFWDERTKGASKDSDHAVNLLWLLAFSKRPLRIQIGAYDSDQADEIRQIIKSILRLHKPLNRFLSQLVDVQSSQIINRRTESHCEILTSDKLGSHGSRPDVVLVNELSHQPNREFASTLLDNLDKMPYGLGIICTNSGFDPSWQLEWKRAFQDSDRWKVFSFNRPAPWIDSDAMAESRRRNSASRFSRLWQGVWSSGNGDAIDACDIDACVTQTEPMTGNEQGFVFFGGLDIGIKKHASAFVVVAKHVGYTEERPPKRHRLSTTQQVLYEAGLWQPPEPEDDSIFHPGTGRLRLAHLQAWKPRTGKRVSLEAIRAAIVEANRRFRLAGIAADPHQAEHLIELLEKDRIPISGRSQNVNTLQEQAQRTLEAFQERMIDIYHHPDLLADLKSLRIKETGTRIRFICPERAETDDSGTAHGDLASALSFAVAIAAEKQHFSLLQPSDTIIAS